MNMKESRPRDIKACPFHPGTELKFRETVYRGRYGTKGARRVGERLICCTVAKTMTDKNQVRWLILDVKEAWGYGPSEVTYPKTIRRQSAKVRAELQEILYEPGDLFK